MTVVFFISLLALSKSFRAFEIIKSIATKVGSLTYAMYMTHFPIQFVMIIFSVSIHKIDFHHVLVFNAFFGLVASIFFVCYDKFELPVQRGLRPIFPKFGNLIRGSSMVREELPRGKGPNVHR